MKDSFFNTDYKTPNWLKDKLSRRQLLKSAAGTSALAILPFSKLTLAQKKDIESTLNAEPWLTLKAVLDHLLPISAQGISATDIKASYYLYQLIHQQPSATDEVDFIYKGVGWLNGYSQNKTSKRFITLNQTDKEDILRGISRSTAGDNWISMLINNLYEAMLAPPSYGGNPNGIGWKWLEHQAGFPLPEPGERYFELPQRSKQPTIASKHIIPTRTHWQKKPRAQGTTKA